MSRTVRPLVRGLAAALLVAGIATACSFPPAEPGAPGLVTLDTWVTGRSKIWDIAFPQGWLAPIYTENDSGAILARFGNTDPARPMGTVSQFDGAFDPSGEGGLMGIALSPGFDGSTNRRAFVCYSTSTDNRVARFDVDYFAATRRLALQLDADRHRPPPCDVPQRVPRALPTRDGRAVRDHGRRWLRDRAAVDLGARVARRCGSTRTATRGPGTRPAHAGTRAVTATRKALRSALGPTTRTPSNTDPMSTTR